MIDYDELHTGKRREAQYIVFWAMLPKFVAIPSAAIPIAILGSIGYVPNVEQTPQVVLAIKAIFALPPAFFSALAFFIALRFPIDERVHARILLGIEAHAKGETAIDPLTGARVLPAERAHVDEDTGWFLDHFSPRELAASSRRGATLLARGVVRGARVAARCCVAAVSIATERVTSLEADPGALAVLAIVTAGFAFAVFCFHLLRLRQSRRLLRGEVSPAVIAAWLEPAEAALPLAPVATDPLG